jgi:hypothetical protein
MGFLNRRHRPRARKKGPWRENADLEAAERVQDAEKEEKPPSPEIVKWRRELRGYLQGEKDE